MIKKIELSTADAGTVRKHCKTIEDGRKKTVRSPRQTDWARTSWLNHGIAGGSQPLINLLKAHKLYAEAGQVASAIKKVQALNIKAYKDRWPKKDTQKEGVDTVSKA